MTDLAQHAAAVAEKLKAAKETVGISESSSAGLISACLLAVPGASAYYLGGAVVYTLAARRGLLGIPDDVLKGLKPVSEDYVALCARTVREKLGATWGIAELGIAGPTGSRYGHDAGISVIGVSGPVEMTRTLATGSNDREANMWAFTKAALDLLADAMSKRG